MGNTTELTSYTFDDYCMSLGIRLQYLVPSAYTQNCFGVTNIKNQPQNKVHCQLIVNHLLCVEVMEFRTLLT